jgi:hypothetical protein
LTKAHLASPVRHRAFDGRERLSRLPPRPEPVTHTKQRGGFNPFAITQDPIFNTFFNAPFNTADPDEPLLPTETDIKILAQGVADYLNSNSGSSTSSVLVALCAAAQNYGGGGQKSPWGQACALIPQSISLAAAAFQTIANDPVDPNYQVLATPTPGSAPVTPTSTGNVEEDTWTDFLSILNDLT